ncbi:hypothetical protein BS78_06G073300 [Paspalum vaginatum]|nr:hypothetical protein BS78_06G073300 [Paspalum vaginatum]
MASPPATVLCTARSSFRLPPHTVLLLLVAALAAPRPARSSSPNAAPHQPTVTFCSRHGQSPAAVTGGELANFLDAVCAGAHMSHNMSWYVVKNRTMYGVAQCRPDVPVPDCAACLAAASSRLIAGSAACAASAVWHDACFLHYSDGDPSRFREDEFTATVFNASGARSPHPHERGGGSRTAVRRLLAAVGKRTLGSYKCSGVGAGAAGGGLVYGLTRCSAGISCDDCRRCLRGALAAVDRDYNGSAGMQVLRLSCMARYESYPFYSLQAHEYGSSGLVIESLNTSLPFGSSPSPAAAPGDHTTAPPFPSAAHSSPGAPAGQPPPTDQTLVMQQNQGRRQKVLMMIIVLTATGAAVIAVIAILIWYHRRSQPVELEHAVDGVRENMYDKNEEPWSTEEEDEDGERTSCQLYSYQVLEAATCCFSNNSKLGSGGFGTVFRGTLENGKIVAVKRIRDSKKNMQELETEVSIVANLRHKNLVRFLGYCFQEEGRFLIYEYVPNNSLEKFWYRASFQPQKLDWAIWFNIVKGVAGGLRFLHRKGIIHRDLKPHNVLLDEKFNPKIADFDLIRMYDKQKTHESTEKVAGTFGYMAPECTSGRKFLLSIKSDVYSYGVLVLEIITGHKIYTFEGQNSEGLVEYVWQHWTEKRASDVVDGDLLGLEGQEHALRQALRCVHVALLCVQADRSKRPDMGQVIAMLRSDDGAELPKPSLPGYVVRSATASGVRLPCMGYR